MRMARGSLIFAALLLSSVAFAGRCADLWAKVLGISGAADFSDYDLRFRAIFEEMAEESFAQLSEVEQARFLEVVEGLVYQENYPKLHLDRFPDLQLTFSGDIQFLLSPLITVLHEHVHLYDQLRLHGSAPRSERWLHTLSATNRRFEVRAFRAMHEFYRKLKAQPDHAELITAVVTRDYGLDADESALYRELISGAGTRYRVNPKTQLLEGLKPEQTWIWYSLLRKQTPADGFAIRDFVTGLALDEATYVKAMLRSYRWEFFGQRVFYLARAAGVSALVYFHFWVFKSLWYAVAAGTL